MINTYYFVLIGTLIVVAYLKLFSLIVSKETDYNSIFPYGEKGIILIATLAILTFTYALVLDNSKKDIVINSGKYFLKSVINFAVGMIFLTGLRDNILNPKNTQLYQICYLLFYIL